MYFNKIAITLLVIFSICASFVIGFFSRDFYDQITVQNQKNRAAERQQFLMMINSERNNNASSTMTPKETYQELLKQRQAEADRIRQ